MYQKGFNPMFVLCDMYMMPTSIVYCVMYYSFHINSWIDPHHGSNSCLNHVDPHGQIDPHN